MTVSSELARQHYTVNAGVRTLAIPFPFQSGPDDIRVVLRQASGTETELTYGSQFTVSGSNVVVDAGFSPWTTNDTVAIILDPPLTQSAALPNAGAFQSEAVEDALDKLVNMQKRSRDIANRSIALTDGSYVGVAGNYDAEGLRISNVGAPTSDNDAATKSSVAAQLAAAILTPSTVVSAAAATVLDDLSTDAMLATLGGGTQGISIFKKATSAAVLTDLGVSAYVQTLLNDADDGEFRTSILAPKWDEHPDPNLLVNPDFQVWQFGPTFNSTTPIAGGNNDGSYFADQWVILSNGANVVNATKYTSPPAGARGAVEFTVQAADTKWGFMQILESQKVIPLRGSAVSLSLQMMATGSLTGMKLYLLSWAGGVDTPTLDPVSAWNAAQVDPTLVANWSIVGSANFTSLGAFGVAKLENLSVPVGANNLAFLVTTWDASFGAGAVVRASATTFHSGLLAQKFAARSLRDEIQECERWFQKTFPLETYPAQNAGNPGCLQAVLHYRGVGNPSLEVMWQFRTRMRTVPGTVTLRNPYAADNNWGDGGGNSLTTAASGHGETGVMIESAPAGAANAVGKYGIHAFASCRF